MNTYEDTILKKNSLTRFIIFVLIGLLCSYLADDIVELINQNTEPTQNETNH